MPLKAISYLYTDNFFEWAVKAVLKTIALHAHHQVILSIINVNNLKRTQHGLNATSYEARSAYCNTCGGKLVSLEFSCERPRC